MTGPSAPPAAEPRPSRAGVEACQAGLTLLELMVSLGLGLVLIIGTGTIYLGSRQAYQMQEGSARLQEAGRYALETIGRSIRQAGTSKPWRFDGPNMPTVCDFVTPDTSTGLVCQPISGADGGGALPDTLVVQFFANNDEEFPVGSGVLGARDCADGFAAIDTLVTNTYTRDPVKMTLTCQGTRANPD